MWIMGRHMGVAPENSAQIYKAYVVLWDAIWGLRQTMELISMWIMLILGSRVWAAPDNRARIYKDCVVYGTA